MNFKITPTAKVDLNLLSTDQRDAVISSIRREIPGSIGSDPVVRIRAVNDLPVQVHTAGDKVVLYRVADVDQDGSDDIVVISVLDQDMLPPPSRSSGGDILTAIADTIA